MLFEMYCVVTEDMMCSGEYCNIAGDGSLLKERRRVGGLFGLLLQGEKMMLLWA